MVWTVYYKQRGMKEWRTSHSMVHRTLSEAQAEAKEMRQPGKYGVATKIVPSHTDWRNL